MQDILHVTAIGDAMEMAVTSARRLHIEHHTSDNVERRLPGVASMRAPNMRRKWHDACSDNLS